MTHFMDIMFVNYMKILTGIDRNIRYQSLVCLNIRSAYELYKLIDNIFIYYNKVGLLIKDIHCDI